MPSHCSSGTLTSTRQCDADPAYRLARLSDQMIGSGMVAGWNMDKDRAYRLWVLEAS
ncbi:hypothetical protein [Arthrobacter sp. ISL-69]|uniref:hypothetical protein n=1 Tax=Arthrobacter sp. ISL-69 TaxID=2819113 RepID=UPI001BE4F684|nr:hypothetical protein [Arthrobacter sp. ISL-69]MBT2538727.1 hypothetical protein [Arthrobacter sp. ISL-69]